MQACHEGSQDVPLYLETTRNILKHFGLATLAGFEPAIFTLKGFLDRGQDVALSGRSEVCKCKW